MKLFILLALAIVAVRSASLDFVAQPGFPEGRIINGQDSKKGAAPFIVSLKRGSHFCGGSIIDKHWVVTAGHCFIYDSFQVVAGLHQRNDESDVQIRNVISKDDLFVHEEYGNGVGPYDIGLIYLAEPFDLNALARDGSAPVGKINLPSGKHEETGRGTLYGWGRNSSGAMPNTLQTLAVNIIGYENCTKALPSPNNLHHLNICSYTTGATDGACNGDSGGPLVGYTAGFAELVGIVSWGYIPCAFTRYPSVYTEVFGFKGWIKNRTDNLYDNNVSN